MFLPKTLLTFCSVWLLYSVNPSNSLIVPQELPSILSLVYSNIPPIKKGTDSRLGFGFRLGEHADFQILVELGPQKETKPIGDQDSDNSFNKRHISSAEQNALLKQQLRKELQRRQHQQENHQELTTTERNAASWLENWSQDMNSLKKKNASTKPKQFEGKKQNEKEKIIPNAPTLPSTSLQQLQLLYKMATTSTTAIPATILNIQSSNDSVGSLHNLRLFDPLIIAERQRRKSQITKELMDVSLEQGE